MPSVSKVPARFPSLNSPIKAIDSCFSNFKVQVSLWPSYLP
jgi:hypothetical protein